MDFTPYAFVPNLSWIAPVLGVSLLLFIAGLFFDYERWAPPAIIASILGILASLAAPTAVGAATKEPIAAWKQTVIEQVEDTYGLTLTEQDVYELGFPRTVSEPKGDYQSYGTIERTVPVGDGFERREITLIWSDGELILAESVSGDEFTELTAR